MSQGALTQLSAIGAQESNFSSQDPKYSVFNEKVKKINNFAPRYHTMIPNGKATWGSKFRMKIDKEGDLLNGLYLSITLPELSIKNLPNNSDVSDNDSIKWITGIEKYVIKNVKLFIGGQLIDEKNGRSMILYDNYIKKENTYGNLDLIMETLIHYNNFHWGNNPEIIAKRELIIPLDFWFSSNRKKALPLIALQYHDIELEIEFNDFETSYNTYNFKTGVAPYNGILTGFFFNNENNKHPIRDLENVKIIGSYTLLDSEERKRVAEADYKILITQTQNRECFLGQGPNNTTRTINLDFNHPVKDLLFYFHNTAINKYAPNNTRYLSYLEINKDFVTEMHRKQELTPGLNHSQYEYLPKDILGEARILINGYERVGWQDHLFYSQTQFEEACNDRSYSRLNDFYYYSFSGDARSETPMGSLNFSRIDNAQLQIRTNKYNHDKLAITYPEDKRWKFDDEYIKIYIQATNYNYLIIKSGMAGLAYTT